AILSMVAIIALIIGLVLPELVSCVKLLVAELPGYIEVVLIWLEDHGILSDENFKFLSEIDWKSRIGEIFNMLTSGMGSVVDTVFKTVTSVFSGIVTALLAIIFAVYLLISKDKLLSQTGRVLRHYLKSGIYDKLHYIFVTFEDCMHKYVVGQCTEAVILGLLCTVGMMIFRFPYATMIGALTAFTALIPIAGAYIGAGVGAFMILTESPMQAFLFLIFIVVLQQLEGNIIYPRVVGSSIGLPGIWVLAAVTIGGGIAGVSGMLLGVPITAAIYRIVRDDMNKKEQKNKIKA
ncbi:MAG: AI-2E family transporter, partial [Clostridia bacterium]|nr:AI-2E family transporter [Clostridia bacterium]